MSTQHACMPELLPPHRTIKPQVMDSSFYSVEMLQQYLHCALMGLLKVSQLLLNTNQLSALFIKLLLLSYSSILSPLHTHR